MCQIVKRENTNQPAVLVSDRNAAHAICRMTFAAERRSSSALQEITFFAIAPSTRSSPNNLP
jgi:hypothetical protein